MTSKWMIRLAPIAAVLIVGCGGEKPVPPAVTKPAETPVVAAPVAADDDEGGVVAEYTAMAVENGGSIAGKVTFTGAVPAPQVIENAKDVAVCHEEKTVQTVNVDASGGLADAVVWIVGMKSGKAFPGTDGAIDQKDCEYHPHVQGMQAGAKLQIANSDAALHNINGQFAGKSMFNVAQPAGSPAIPKKLKLEGPVELKCDVHSWMHAWVFVSAHPYYAVTGADGSFSLTDVPAGTYQVKVWHETLGEQEMSVTVAAGAPVAADFGFPKM